MDPLRRLDPPPGGWSRTKHLIQNYEARRAHRTRLIVSTAALCIILLIASWFQLRGVEPVPPSVWTQKHPDMVEFVPGMQPVRIPEQARSNTGLLHVTTNDDVLFYRVLTIERLKSPQKK